MHAVSLSSPGPPNDRSISSAFSSQPSSLASLPIRTSGGQKPLQQTNILPTYDSTTFGASKSEQHPNLTSENFVHSSLNSAEIQIAADFPEFESESGSFKLLEEDAESDRSLISSVLSSPHIAEQQQAVLNSIQRTQVGITFGKY